MLFFTSRLCVFSALFSSWTETRDGEGGPENSSYRRTDKKLKILHNSQKAIFFLLLAGLQEKPKKLRWHEEINRTIKEVRRDERGTRREIRACSLCFNLYFKVYLCLCCSRAIPHFPAPQTGLFWWMTHQSTTPVTDTARLTKARLCHRRKSTEDLSNPATGWSSPRWKKKPTFHRYLCVFLLVCTHRNCQCLLCLVGRFYSSLKSCARWCKQGQKSGKTHFSPETSNHLFTR